MVLALYALNVCVVLSNCCLIILNDWLVFLLLHLMEMVLGKKNSTVGGLVFFPITYGEMLLCE